MHGKNYVYLLIPILVAPFCYANEAENDKKGSKLAEILINSVKKSADKEPQNFPNEGIKDFEKVVMLDKKELNNFDLGEAFADVEGRSMGDQNDDKEMELGKRGMRCSVQLCFRYEYCYHGGKWNILPTARKCFACKLS